MNKNKQEDQHINLLKAMENKIHFNTKREPSIIKVIGVGGGGGNAVNHMFKQGIEGVDFVVCNTDMQALEASPVPVKVQLGNTGLGAGSVPDVAEKAAIESLDKLKSVLDSETQMIFITAGMGGGTGTGAAPVIAKFAREQGLLSVGIVTLPFRFEGRRKMLRAQQGIAELRKYVDTLLVISNDKLRLQYGDLGLGNAFAHADDVLTSAARGIAELITVHGYVNVDFEDVKTVMKDSGKAIMGSAIKSGEDRAYKAIEEAMQSPLLDDTEITGARNILLYIYTSHEKDVTMDEITVITEYISDKCGDNDTDVIWGRGFDDSMGDSLGVTIIATGFNSIDEKPTKSASSVDATYTTYIKQEPSKTEVINNEKEPPRQASENTSAHESPELNTLETTPVSSSGKKEEKIIHTLNENPDENKPAISSAPQLSDAHHTENKGQKVYQKIVRKNPGDFENPDNHLPDKTAPIKQEQTDALDDKLRKASEERKRKLEELSGLPRKHPISEQEKIPAYKRKNIQLSEPNYSSQSQVSKYTLSEDGKKNAILKSDNSFLHDNVD